MVDPVNVTAFFGFVQQIIISFTKLQCTIQDFLCMIRILVIDGQTDHRIKIKAGLCIFLLPAAA